MSDTLSRPETIAAKLFSLRAAQLVHNTDTITLRSRLSGLLIGLELAGSKPYWLGRNVAILGAGSLAELYRKGLDAQGVPAVVMDVENLTLAGLCAAYNSKEGASE